MKSLDKIKYDSKYLLTLNGKSQASFTDVTKCHSVGSGIAGSLLCDKGYSDSSMFASSGAGV